MRRSIRVEKLIQRATLMKNSGRGPSTLVETTAGVESREPATHSKPCPYCKGGWVRVPDGMGCVDWDFCPECDGTNTHREKGNAG